MKLLSNNILPRPDASFASILVAWQKKYGRHSLPWQNTRDAYRIWLSEIMLQQTQVSTVIPYYLRFLEFFPDVYSLAAASNDEVMKYWSGLGYYSRARNLHKCARIVVNEYGGIFPSDPESLEKLPGIGKSTAAAIAAFSAGAKAAILDGNVVRVFSRVFGIRDSITEKAGKNRFWELAYELLPETDIEAYTQGLMDLGATICVRSKPDCVKCPFSHCCVALSENRISELPVRKIKKASPLKKIIMLVLESRGQILLEKRPESGIWGGLYSLPEWETDVNLRKHKDEMASLKTHVSSFGEAVSVTFLEPFVHVFSHFRLQVTPCVVTLSRRNRAIAPDAYVWYDIMSVNEAPLPAPVRKLLNDSFRQKSLKLDG
ncbi:A/G-specific adenine glycosylase [Oxalobacter paraformigenes]|uniref:Adenine DNA glycosylase n=1 Tax=Oxalobacter paraformigenes TaxID=556268 RepID=C3X6B5_9BURK|nr:A/G-specific adenine glycosylase [Oxalobacter paraformigenes]EEO28751.1 A/G-specific adenine glycosylase [Oxalobacter paraformigenes]